MRIKPCQFAWPAVLWLTFAASTLSAGSFRVAPVRIDLTSHRPHSTLEISNAGTDRVTVQAEAFAWQFERDEDRLEDTDDVLVNPPIFTIEPGGTQLLRLGLREWIPGDVERTYRVILEEVPPARRPDDIGIRTLLRISIPLFVQPNGGASPELVWSAVQQADGRVALAVENVGKQHARLRQFSVTSDDRKETDFVMSVPTYILAGTRRLWTIDGGSLPRARELHVRGQTEEAELHATAAVGVR